MVISHFLGGPHARAYEGASADVDIGEFGLIIYCAILWLMLRIEIDILRRFTAETTIERSEP